jgi:hypothetical protein
MLATKPSEASLESLLNSRFDALRHRELQWLPALGIGFYPVTEQPYDVNYWENYRAMDLTPTGAQLTAGRIELVDAFWHGHLVDVGIGGGRFCQERAYTSGFDINPEAIKWLKAHRKWHDPYLSHCEAVSFWDCFEHIHDPLPLLDNVKSHVFMSLPIFDGPEHVLRSKHFKINEHCWYFTPKGLERFMERAGFWLVYHDRREEDAGREGIGSFVFTRKEPQ